jgi:hypothetical protein
MNAEGRESREWECDELLKTAFADDLPAEVAAGMRERIERFRAGTARQEVRAAARGWLLPRSAWALLSILILAAGILLQSLGSPTPLAERISAIKSEIAGGGLGRRPGFTPERRGGGPGGLSIIRR